MLVGAMAGNLDHYGVPAFSASLDKLAARPTLTARGSARSLLPGWLHCLDPGVH